MGGASSKGSAATAEDSGLSEAADPIPDFDPHWVEGRNLVVCIDGTSNQFGGKNTNVIEFYHLLEKDKRQLTYYNSGIGTYAKPSWRSYSYLKQVADNLIDLGIAWNLEKIIIKAYRWLSERYRLGDRIYLIGFSRGAYQVRALSAMIEIVGLIHRGNEDQIPFAYELYADSENGSSKEKEDAAAQAARFKKTFSRSVKVHFVGVWDTVSSVGTVRGKTLPGTTSGMKHVCYFRHALALDERRVKFLPEYAYGNTTRSVQDRPADGSGEDHSSCLPAWQGSIRPHTKEVWFTGTHSDIGGGNTSNKNMNRSGPPLVWMLSEALDCALLINTDTTETWNWEAKEGVHESLHGAWWLLECIPFKRLAYTTVPKSHKTRCFPGRSDKKNSDRNPAQRVTYKPHLGKGRKIQLGQFIHGSVLRDESLNKRIPKASLPPSTWTEMTDSILGTSMLEQDYFAIARQLVRDLGKTAQSQDLLELMKRLTSLNQSPVGRWTLGVTPGAMEAIIQTIFAIGEQTGEEYLAPHSQFTQALLRLFVDKITGDRVEQLLPALFHVLADSKSDVTEVARGLVLPFINNFSRRPFSLASLSRTNLRSIVIGTLCDKGDFALIYTQSPVLSAVFTPDGNIISMSENQDIQIWDAATGLSVLPLLEGHPYWICCIAISCDGRFIASGSADGAVRVWSLQTGASVGDLWTGHTGSIWSLVFSSDSKRLVSGSRDNTVGIWDVEKGGINIGMCAAHSGDVNSVAVSPDGQLIASGSHDTTIRIWSLETGENIGESLGGHAGLVLSVTFTPDSKQIVSGSQDNTVRIWDVATGQCVKQMEGHTGWVRSVVVSVDQRFVVSGSLDNTIRIWNLHTGASVGVPLSGHTDGVLSVAFSPNSQYIVSSSRDGTIRRWRLSALDTTISDSASGAAPFLPVPGRLL